MQEGRSKELVALEGVELALSHKFHLLKNLFAVHVTEELLQSGIEKFFPNPTACALKVISRAEQEGLAFFAVQAGAAFVFSVSVSAELKLLSFLVSPAPVVWEAPGYVVAENFVDEDVVVKLESCSLPGVLSLPNKASSVAVVLVHGSGPCDMDGTMGAVKPLKDLALGLASRGIAVLRYTKRTIQCPLPVATEKEEVDEAVHAAVKLLQERGFDQIGLVGHSQGGSAAPRIARDNTAVRKIVLLGANARPFQDALVSQLNHIQATSPSDELLQIIAAAQTFKQRLDQKTYAADETMSIPVGGTAPGSYFLAMSNYNIGPVLCKLEIPALILQGERDYQVTVSEDFDALKRAAGENPKHKFCCFDGLNHAFVRCNDPSTPQDYAVPGHVDERVVVEIGNFFLSS